MKNLKISNRIYLSLGACVVLVLILGSISWFYINSLWENTKNLYDHPHTVQKAIGELQSDMLRVRLEMKDLVLDADNQLAYEHIQRIDALDADAVKQFDILSERYLGPKGDLDNAWKSYVTYKSIREETIRIFQSGDRQRALSRTDYDGVGGMQAELTFRNLNKISSFAANKSEEFYNSALNQKNEMARQLLIIIAIILIMASFIVYILVKSINEPLKELITAINEFKQGNLTSRSKNAALNEFGHLSSVFNTMAESIESKIFIRQNSANFSSALFNEDKLRTFSAKLLSTLTSLIGAQMGAIYLLNDQKTAYEYFDSIGLSESSKAAFSAQSLEGEFGLALSTKEIQHIVEIAQETRFDFTTVYDTHRAKEIITIPILKGSEVFAIVSIASVHAFSLISLELVKEIWQELCARMNSVVSANQVADYAQKLEATNSELDAQAKEVAMQRDELSEQNIELEMQKKLLDEASRLKSSFLSNMSHELRTPLNSVIALASVLGRRLANKIPEEEYSYIDVIERNGKHLLELVNDILDLSRIEAGKEYLSLSRFTVYQLVNEVVDMIEPQAVGKNVKLINNTPKDLVEITSDLSKCRHILINIISNAVKFTDEGQVAINAGQFGNEMHITVADTGIGISENKLGYIFDEFRQGDETPSRQSGGTGLGLAIARKYANLISGSIEVNSIPGKGSVFTLKVPLKIELADTDSEEFFEEHIAGKYGTTNRKTYWAQKSILLVEDSEPAIIQMMDILVEEGYQTRVARNGREALEQIEIALPDAMILDLMMPEVDGFQVLGAIRSVPKTAEVPVLILTAKHVSKEELKFLKGNHISQLIQKGAISKKDLLASVSVMVSGGAHHQSLPESQLGRIKPTILVVEDNQDNRMTVKALLQESYQIIEAVDGQAGIEEALENKPSLILLDISLPKVDGFKVLDALRNDETTSKIPIVALTARVMTGDREKILSYGFDGYVSKPIDEAVLKDTIRSFLDGR